MNDPARDKAGNFNLSIDCRSACNVDPLSGGIGVQF
jgi:hypothetical protein